MLMQENGGNAGAMLVILGALATITMVLWVFLPFAIFGKGASPTSLMSSAAQR